MTVDAGTLASFVTLWLWRPDAGEWTHCGSGTVREMSSAQRAAVQAAAAIGVAIDAGPVYRVARDKPAPLHAPRRVVVELPAPDEVHPALEDGPDLRVWRHDPAGSVDDWSVEVTGERLIVSVGSGPRWRDMHRDRARALGLALVAATQPVRDH